MCPWLTRAAILATLIFPQLPGNAAAAQSGLPGRPVRAYAVVERLVDHRNELALDSSQVVRLTDLAQRLRANPGRLRITGHSAPGKAGPRVERKRISRAEGLRKALRELSPEQRVIAVRLIELDTTSTAHR